MGFKNKDDEKAYKKRWWEENKERMKKRKREYYQSHKDQHNERTKKYYEDHKKEILERVKKYRENHRDYYMEKDKKYYEENKEQLNKRSHDEYHKNKEHYKEAHKKYYEEHKDKCNVDTWKNATKKKFGITIDFYNEMMINQNHKCAICGKDQSEVKQRFAVDHDHVTGKIRGLLCHNCNISLGGFQDNPEMLLKAASYLLK